jgi:hypothetical protein
MVVFRLFESLGDSLAARANSSSKDRHMKLIVNVDRGD